jgi:hypothetical protein
MKVRSSFFSTALLFLAQIILLSCDGTGDLRKGIGKFFTDIPPQTVNPTTSGNNTNGTTTGSTTNGNPGNNSWACQHPDAVNSTPICHETPGPCIFYACKDQRFAEYEIYLSFKRYVEDHGGEIFHDPNLCVTPNPPGENICNHPSAVNYLEEGDCNFKACNDPDYLEYHQYEDFMEWVEENGGTVTADNSLCLTEKQILGCTDSRATNYNPEATAPDTCVFKACNDPNYQGYDAQLISEFNNYINNIGGGEIQNDQSQCGDLKISGCQLQQASNWVENAEIPTACIFKACTDQSAPNYNQSVIDILNSLLADYSAGGEIVNDPNLCSSTEVVGCMLPGATGANPYNPNANTPGPCTFELCLDTNYLGYNAALVALYQGFVSSYSGGGEVVNNQSLCGVQSKLGCMLVGADNYDATANKPGPCTFKTCTNSQYLGFNQGLMDQYQNLINNYTGGGQVTNDQAQCGEAIVEACLHPMATNFNSSGNKENGSCTFAGCLNENAGIYYNLALQHAVTTYQAQLAAAQIPFTGSVDGNVNCDKPGCTDQSADNWSPIFNIEDGTCNFSGCFDSQFAEYDPAKYQAIQTYLANLDAQNISHSGQITPFGCQTPTSIPGCMVDFAVNYNSNANEENGTCQFKTCLDPAYEEYNPDHKLRIDDYLAEWTLELNEENFESTCSTPRKQCNHPDAINYTGENPPPPLCGGSNQTTQQCIDNHPFVSYVCDDFGNKFEFCSNSGNLGTEICDLHLDYTTHCQNAANINTYYCHLFRIYKSYCDPNTSTGSEYCIFTACTLEGYEGYDQYQQYLNYINQFGGEIIPDNSPESCGNISTTDGGTTDGNPDNETFDITVQYNSCDHAQEDVDIHLIYDNSSSMTNILTKVKQALSNLSNLLAGTNSTINFYALCDVDSNLQIETISNSPLVKKKTYHLPAPVATVNINGSNDISQLSSEIAAKLNTINLVNLDEEKGMCFISRMIDYKLSNSISRKQIISIVTDENDTYGEYTGYYGNYCPTAHECLKSYEVKTQTLNGYYLAKVRALKVYGDYTVNNEVQTKSRYAYFDHDPDIFNYEPVYVGVLNSPGYMRGCTDEERNWLEVNSGVSPIEHCKIKAVNYYTLLKENTDLKNAIGSNNCGATNFNVGGVNYPNVRAYYMSKHNKPYHQFVSCHYQNSNYTFSSSQNVVSYLDFANNAPTMSQAQLYMLNQLNASAQSKVGFAHVVYDVNNNSCVGVENSNKQHGAAYLGLHTKLLANSFLSSTGDVCKNDNNATFASLISTQSSQVPLLKYYINGWPTGVSIQSIEVKLIGSSGNELPISNQDYLISTDSIGTFIEFNSNLQSVLSNYTTIRIEIILN